MPRSLDPGPTLTAPACDTVLSECAGSLVLVGHQTLGKSAVVEVFYIYIGQYYTRSLLYYIIADSTRFILIPQVLQNQSDFATHKPCNWVPTSSSLENGN